MQAVNKAIMHQQKVPAKRVQDYVGPLSISASDDNELWFANAAWKLREWFLISLLVGTQKKKVEKKPNRRVRQSLCLLNHLSSSETLF
jgi:hypothetical protein